MLGCTEQQYATRSSLTLKCWVMYSYCLLVLVLPASLPLLRSFCSAQLLQLCHRVLLFIILGLAAAAVTGVTLGRRCC